MPRESASIAILSAYYPRVFTLFDYIRVMLRVTEDSAFEAQLLQASDSDSFRDFLFNTRIACSIDNANPSRFNLTSTSLIPSMKEVIQAAQKSLFKSCGRRLTNILTAGYENNGSNLSVRHLNTTITAFENHHWEMLLQRTGEDIIYHILTMTCVFSWLPNDCLCQITGEPILSIKPPNVNIGPILSTTEASGATDNPSKRRSQDAINGIPPAKRARILDFKQSARRSAADVSFDRSRLFYARPTSLKGRITAGLPPKHILNILIVDVKKSVGSTAVRAMKSRHLAKHIFPCHFGLPSAFETGLTGLAGHAVLEAEIKKKGRCRVPKRLRGVVDILEKMIWRHHKCAYKCLRNLACPSKLPRYGSTSVDSSIILEMMSEESILMNTQLLSSRSTPVTVGPTTPKPSTKKAKPRFAEFMCSYAEVFRYVSLVTNAVIPHRLWGTAYNRKVVMTGVKRLIAARRYESISLHNIMQGFRVSDCEWLQLKDSQVHVPPSEQDVRRRLIEEFIYWYFNAFVIPLLRTTFYATESGAFRKRVLYFRQDDWDLLCAPLVERLTADTFVKVDEKVASEVLRQRKIGFSFVRLLPKETGVRPIVNLRRKPGEHKNASGRQQSINDILQVAFQVLTYEKEARPDLLGSSIFGQDGIYGRLKAYKTKLLSRYGPSSNSWPKLYFVKVDVQACFDTIEQEKLLSLLRDIIVEDGYALARFGQISQAAGKVKRKYAKKAAVDGDVPHFLQLARELAQIFRAVIFVDQVCYPSCSRDEILALLDMHISENIVKIGEDYYRQKVGIPQGSVCSSLLCSLFYGDLEKQHLQFTRHDDSLLLRLIDDYLFVTTDLSKAQRFLQTMKQGHPEYGCFISQDKTLTNFDSRANLLPADQHKFPWCGLFIDTQTLSITTDYTRFHDTYLADSLTVDYGRHSGAGFLQKMLQLAKAKSHILFCDTDLSTLKGVYFNIYQHYLLLAMKMQRYILSWSGARVNRNVEFIHRVIGQVVRYAYASIRTKSRSHLAQRYNGCCDIDRAAVIWLGTTAFHTTLRMKPAQYSKVATLLARDLARTPRKSRVFKGRFGVMLKEANELISVLSF